MNNLNKSCWKVALYFLSFESIYWTIGNKWLQDIRFYINHGDYYLSEYGLNNMLEYVLYLVNPVDFIISLIFFILSLWCFKQFVKSMVELIRGESLK